MTSSVSYCAEFEETSKADVYYTKKRFYSRRLSPNEVVAVLNWVIQDTVMVGFYFTGSYLFYCSWENCTT